MRDWRSCTSRAIPACRVSGRRGGAAAVGRLFREGGGLGDGWASAFVTVEVLIRLTEARLAWWHAGQGMGGIEMIECWAIIGAGNTRKSSTMRALTGAFGRQSRWKLARPADAGGVRSVTAFVDTTSPQERKVFLSPDEFAQVIQDAIREHGVTHAFVCLRPTTVRRSNANSDDYLKAFCDAGWKLGGKVEHTPDLAKLPANHLAASLRLKWGFI